MMLALKSVGRRISDLLAAAAFAEEGGAESARELLREQGERPAEKREEARSRELNIEKADRLPAR